MARGPYYGPLTRAAVNRIQPAAGITLDGGVNYGAKTRAALQDALDAKARPPPVVDGTLKARDASTAKKIDAVLAGYPGSKMQGKIGVDSSWVNEGEGCTQSPSVRDSRVTLGVRRFAGSVGRRGCGA